MTKDEAKIMVSETRSFLRDFKIKEIMEDPGNKIEIIPPKRGFFSFLWKGYKTMDQLYSLGSILTGSQALSMYHINGKKILNRKPDDWDFMIDKKSFMKFCGLNNLTDIKYGQDRMTINLTKGIYTFDAGYTNYDPRYMFRHDIDIISKESIPTSIEIGGIRVCTLEYIIEEKLKLIERGWMDQQKHIDDCVQIMTKIEAYGKV